MKAFGIKMHLERPAFKITAVSFISLILFFCTNSSFAAPTIHHPITSAYNTPSIQNSLQITSRISDCSLVKIGEEIISPHVGSIVHSAARSLPPAPAAILMTLMGFMCVSFFNDRKFWLAIIVSLICFGQNSSHVLSQKARQNLVKYTHHQRDYHCEYYFSSYTQSLKDYKFAAYGKPAYKYKPLELAAHLPTSLPIKRLFSTALVFSTYESYLPAYTYRNRSRAPPDIV